MWLIDDAVYSMGWGFTVLTRLFPVIIATLLVTTRLQVAIFSWKYHDDSIAGLTILMVTISLHWQGTPFLIAFHSPKMGFLLWQYS